MITLKGNIANLEGTSSDQKPNDVPVNTIFRELDTNCSYYFTGEAWVEIPSSGGGGGGGTDSYNDLENKPQINSVTLSGNKSLANLGIQGELTFDNEPTEDSTNPVTSGGVYSALANKQDTLTIDSAPTESSTNPVESGGVYTALGNKQDTLTFDGTYNASTNKAATESTVSGAVSTAIGNLSKSDVGLDNVTNNAQVKAVSGSVTNGGIATFGADGATVADSGKTIETSLTDTNDKLPTSKAIRDNVAANATLASGYTVDTSETSITSSTKINDAIEQLDYRTATNKTNILSIRDTGFAQKNLCKFTLGESTHNGVLYTNIGDNTVKLSTSQAISAQSATIVSDIQLPSNRYAVKVIADGITLSDNTTFVNVVYKLEDNVQRNVNVSSEYLFNYNCVIENVSIYVRSGQQANGTIQIMICERSVYEESSTIVPYALPNTTLTPALVECVDKGKKNKIPISKMTTSVQTTGNITFTPNGDGTFTATATGTNSSTTNFYIAQGLTANEVKNGDYMSGCPSDTGGIYLNVQMEVDPYTRTGKDYGSGEVIEGISSSYTYRVVCTIPANINPNNKIFKPMICSDANWAVSKTYEPPAMTNAELTKKVEHINGYRIDTGGSNTSTKTFNLSNIENGLYLVLVTNATSSTNRYGISLYCLRKSATEINLLTAIKEVQTATITSITVSGDVATITYGDAGYHDCRFIAAT